MTPISIIGCGWLGLPLARHFADLGHPVLGSTTRSEKLPLLRQAGITPHQLQLTPSSDLDGHPLLNARVAVITIPPSKGDGKPQFYLRQMAHLAAAIEASAIDKLVFISATSVYPQNNSEVTEADAERIESPFSDCPWLDIEACFTSLKHVSTTVVRFSGLIGGEYQPGRYFSGRELGGADDPVNMIHRDDCIGIISAIVEQGAWGEVFNASACEHPSRRELYSRSCELAGLAPPIFIADPRPYRLVNCDKVKRQLGYRFRHPNPVDALGLD
ncbi:hypothetical protein [Ferrimonas sp. SCSIO 43195]|uniref:hypothetical protein n=1 Tax=Ferrimonas sp. SCSIO 43195 TaxID=2822844 RepID=UPI002074F448|nr:hypothetical protein [Ferrimonas sp. SCSIO 43195]USD38435.1 hypothetical protein J8Z22_04660 [Ferrimonas sp. SCSIO 43195]